jgi:hypothetical protein
MSSVSDKVSHSTEFLKVVTLFYLVSRAGIGVQAVRRYGSGQIGYRAMYVRIGNPVVCSIDRT